MTQGKIPKRSGRSPQRLSPRKDEIKMLVFAHTGTLDGFGPLETFGKN
jgi:hypothetical protein